VRWCISVQRMKRLTLAAVALATVTSPATASAASIEVAAPNGVPVIAYNAGPGEVNALRMHGTVDGFDLRMAFFEFSSRLTAGSGCLAGFPTICGQVDQPFPVEVSLGDRADVASVNSFTGFTTLDAGSGDDDVLAGGLDATADGGPGSDTVRVAANNGARGNGGSGRDQVTGGLGAVAAILTGGGGNDLLVPDGSLFDDARGGSGDDRLVTFKGRQVTLAGETGSDVLIAPAISGRVTLDGGPDSDIVFTHAGGATVDAGSGADAVDVRGGAETPADTVSCGTGWDAVWADSIDDVADDCEIRLRTGSPLPSKLTPIVQDAQALLEHEPDPSRPRK
jgi:hypothetical protein